MYWGLVVAILAGLSFAAADYAKYAEFVEQQATNETFVKLFNQHLTQFEDDNKNLQAGAPFTCKPYLQPAEPSTSVHSLRPVDVKVIGAIGDSITAGTGIKAITVLGLLKQDRGLSWSIGGDKTIATQITLPNILEVYGNKPRGFSRGWGPVSMKSVSHLNLANPGDKSENMPAQAEELVQRMKEESGVNFEQDWKVITLFIGGNDLCDFCEDKEKFKAENYVAHIQKALDYLHANVPRAFVNVVEVLDVSLVKSLNQNVVCNILHWLLCKCAAYPANSQAEAELKAETERYRELTNRLVLSGRYDTRDDFTVVVQPFFRETQPAYINGKPDLSYFAPDCFHLSLKGHRAATEALWNNMIEPVGRKRTQWTPDEAVECPSAAAPYFYTYKNSVPTNSYNGQGQGHDLVRKAAKQGDTQQSGSSSVTIATVAMIAAFAVLVVGALIGRKIWGDKRRNKGEQEMLIKSKYERI